MRGPAAGLVLALLALAGCSDPLGGDDDGASGGGEPSMDPGSGREATLAVAAVGAYPANPAFDPPAASVPAGAVVHVTFRNEDVAPVVQHNWVVEGIAGASSDTVGPGGESAFDFTAPSAPGEFVFYCSVGDHRDRGMEGTLTVEA